MVEHPDVDEGEGVAQPGGDELVRVARLGHPRRMVVGQDERCGVVRERLAQHLTRVHRCAVDGAAEQFLEGDQAVAVVEVEAAEDLVGTVSQLRRQEAAGVGRGVQRLAGAHRRPVMAARELERALQQRHPRRAEPGRGERAVGTRREQSAQRTEFIEQVACEVERTDAARAGAEDQREQLRVRQRRRAARQQLLARALGAGPVADGADDGHGRSMRGPAPCSQR